MSEKKKRKCTRGCSVVDCKSRASLEENVHFYSFPNKDYEIERKKKWVAAVRRITKDGKPWFPSKYSVICSKHFVGGKKSNDPRKESFHPTIFPPCYKNRATYDNARAERAAKGKILQESRSTSSIDSNDIPDCTNKFDEKEINEELKMKQQQKTYENRQGIKYEDTIDDFAVKKEINEEFIIKEELDFQEHDTQENYVGVNNPEQKHSYETSKQSVIGGNIHEYVPEKYITNKPDTQDINGENTKDDFSIKQEIHEEFIIKEELDIQENDTQENDTKADNSKQKEEDNRYEYVSGKHITNKKALEQEVRIRTSVPNKASRPLEAESCKLRSKEFERTPFIKNRADDMDLSDDSVEEFIALELSPLILRRISQRRYQKRRKMWVNHIYARRKEFGEFSHLWRDLQNDDDQHFSYFGMRKGTFRYILENISSKLEKFSNFRETISPEERLAVTLRYLTTGASFKTLGNSFRISDVTVGRIIHETCATIWKSLCKVHMAFPSDEDVDEISKEFWKKWKFPNCVGCIGGKHIRIKSSQHSELFSIVLQGVVGSDYKFICIDVEAYNKQSDGGIFDLSNLNRQLQGGALKVQYWKQLPDSDLRTPHVLIGDEGYPLKPYLMRPYADRRSGPDEAIFNERLSLVRQTVKCAFGIISNKWRILLKALEVTAERANVIVKCICLLHNIIIDKEGLTPDQSEAINNDSGHSKPIRFATLASALLAQTTPPLITAASVSKKSEATHLEERRKRLSPGERHNSKVQYSNTTAAEEIEATTSTKLAERIVHEKATLAENSRVCRDRNRTVTDTTVQVVPVRAIQILTVPNKRKIISNSKFAEIQKSKNVYIREYRTRRKYQRYVPHNDVTAKKIQLAETSEIEQHSDKIAAEEESATEFTETLVRIQHNTPITAENLRGYSVQKTNAIDGITTGPLKEIEQIFIKTELNENIQEYEEETDVFM